MPDPARPGERTELSARVTTPLLTLITQQSLDEDYVRAAERRKAGLSGPRSGRPWVTAAVVIGVFGLLVSTAAVQTSRDADVNDASRATLITRIETRDDRLARQQDRLAQLRSRNAAADNRLATLTESAEAVEAQVGRLQVTTGFVAVRGEGVRATVDNADSGDPNGIVRDSDLALLVNALWSAGAEAIAVNGQRVTVLTSIRTSGNAIEVNSIAIAPPYTVVAIGDRGSMQANFYETSSGLAFDGLARGNGIPFDMENVEQISIPAAPTRLLRLRSVRAGLEGEEHEPAPGEEPE